MSSSGAHWLIVGGSRGLGRVLAEQAVAESLVSVVSRNRPEHPVAGAHHLEADITDPASLRKAVDEAKARAPLTTLALVQRYRGEGDDLAGELQTTLVGARDAIEAALPAMSDGGSIVVMSSIASRLVLGEQPIGYHVARAALEQLVRYYAVTLGERRIRVNAVSSGSFIKPESEAYYRGNEDLVALHAELSPLGRIPFAGEVASAMRFFASDAASCITGQHLLVDGGISLGGHEAVGRRLKGF